MIKVTEEIARRYCEIFEVDPEKMVPFDNGTEAYATRPRWRSIQSMLCK